MASSSELANITSHFLFSGDEFRPYSAIKSLQIKPLNDFSEIVLQKQNKCLSQQVVHRVKTGVTSNISNGLIPCGRATLWTL